MPAFMKGALKVIARTTGSDYAELRFQGGDIFYYAELVKVGGENFRMGVAKCEADAGGRLLPCFNDHGEREEAARAALGGLSPRGYRCLPGKRVFWSGSRPSARPGSSILVPFDLGGSNVGLLILKGSQGAFDRGVAALAGALAANVAVAYDDRRVYWRLRERVKELSCLYQISEIAAQPAVTVSALFNAVVKVLPPAMQYPDLAVARIRFDDTAYASDEWLETSYRLVSDIKVFGDKRGEVEVQYKEARYDYDARLFLFEEQKLLDAVARELGLILERRLFEEESTRLRDQIKRADALAAVGRLAASVAHELNEPLEVILAFAELVHNTSGVPAAVGRDLEKILKAALHARDVVKKFLIYARQAPSVKREVDLNAVVAETLSFLEPMCEKRGIVCVSELADGLPYFVADTAELRQIILNLAMNAIQAMPNGGRLSVRTGLAGETVYLSVEDTGAGMTEEVRTNIFQPFFTTRPEGQGTGLGLTVVEGIVASYGGKITVRSEVGRGSCFEVWLPVDSAGREGGKNAA